MKNICFQLSRKACLTFFMMVLMALPALAQKITVNGTVYEPDGEPAIGVSVTVQGQTGGVVTDIDGNFRIQVQPNATLVVSMVGYQTQNVPVNGRTQIDVTLKDDNQLLNELVVIGYGQVKKEDATGSVAVIKPDDIEAGLATSTQELLVGASPGVVVTTDGGSPTGGATIRIRGGSSLNATNDPLIVIDGVAQTNQSTFSGTNVNALTMLNPENIESMTILKDASATAIYGSRASNGVIIVTTKKGKSGKPQVNFAANFNVQTARKTLDLMDGVQFANLVKNNLGETSIAQLGTANTDWQKEVLRTTFSQDYNLSVGGTLKNLPYRVSASFTDNNGILKTSGMKRTNVGINLSPKFFEDHLQVNANVNGTYIDARFADQGAIGAATTFNPTLPVYTAYKTVGNTGMTMYNGFTNVVSNTSGMYESMAAQNPLQMLLDKNEQGKSYASTGNLQLDYALHFLPELHLNLNLGYQVSQNKRNTEIAENSIMAWRGNYNNGCATFTDWYELQRNTSLEFYMNYKKEFAAIKSNLDVMAGYTWQKMDYHGRSKTVMNSLGFYKFGDSDHVMFQDGVYNLDYNPATEAYIGHTYNDSKMGTWANPLQLISFYGRLNYSFDNTYLLTFTLRDDATSRFSKDSRWGLFPSVALGWKILNMDFMESAQSWMNEFKLRLGWGITGQQDLGGSFFPYLAIYNQSGQGGWYPWSGQYYDNEGNALPNGWISPLYPSAFDSNIKWEETTTWNAGIDLAFLSNRITVALDWYLRNTNDLLAWVPVAGIATSNYMNRNIGTLRNIGAEVSVTARPVVTHDFTWTTGVNVAYNKSKITKLTGNAATDAPIQSMNTPSGTGTGLAYHMVGYAPNTYLVYQQVYDQAGEPIDGVYVDQNADGVIDDADKIMYHSPDPKFTASWNNTFSYKNWDFGFNLRANFGNYVYNNPKFERSRLSSVDSYGLNNLLNNAHIFRTADDKLVLSDYFIENASFVRCDNITLGYTWPHLLNNALRLRVFGAVQNPFVITKYKGLDPEVFSGIDSNVYPRPVTFNLGIVATF